jgi:hypothetical protein
VSTEPDPGNIQHPATFAILTYTPERRHTTYAVVTVHPDTSVTVGPRRSLGPPRTEVEGAVGQ